MGEYDFVLALWLHIAAPDVVSAHVHALPNPLRVPSPSPHDKASRKVTPKLILFIVLNLFVLCIMESQSHVLIVW